jgi:hypothetical protein
MSGKVMRCGKAKYAIEGGVVLGNLVAPTGIGTINTSVEQALPLGNGGNGVWTDIGSDDLGLRILPFDQARSPPLPGSQLQDALAPTKGFFMPLKAREEDSRILHFVDDDAD